MASRRCCCAMRRCCSCSCWRRRISAAMACCWRWASALLANIELIKEVAAPCMKLLTIGFVVLLTIIRLTLLVSMSCLKLPVLEIMAPPVEEEADAEPSGTQVQGDPELILRAASHCAGVTPLWLLVPLQAPISAAHPD